MAEIDIASLPPELAEYIKSLKQEVTTLEEKSQSLEKENTSLKKTLEKQSVFIQNMNEMLVKNKKAMFGKSSEQLKYIDGSEQISIFNEAEKEYDGGAVEPTEQTIVEAHNRKPKRTKEELTAGLKHYEVICELNDEEKLCKACGTELVVIGKEKLRSELNIVPQQLFVIDYYRNVYKCAECEKKADEAVIIKADAPVAVMKKSMASATTVAYVIQEKYQMGVPLYRQEQYWKSNGINLNRNTLANWIIRSSQWFVPLWEYMRKALLSLDVIHADETELKVLKDNGKPVDSMSRMWVFCSGKHEPKQLCLYKYHATRSGKVAKEMLEEYSKYLQTDGYSGYNIIQTATRIGCWAHVRRKWTDCLPKGIDSTNSKAAKALELVEKLFAIEILAESLTIEEIQKLRDEQSKPVLDAYWSLLESIDAPGGSNLHKAVEYSFNQKKHLENVMLDGRLEFTNNRAERAVKPFVMARKNFLFSDTSKGADASAMCFSIIETAKLNNLNVYGYLTYLLTELPKFGENPTTEQLELVMPWALLPDYCRNTD